MAASMSQSSVGKRSGEESNYFRIAVKPQLGGNNIATTTTSVQKSPIGAVHLMEPVPALVNPILSYEPVDSPSTAAGASNAPFA